MQNKEQTSIRNRLEGILLKNGPLTFSDQELLEFLLLHTNSLEASGFLKMRLFMEFEDFSSVISAAQEKNPSFSGVNDNSMLLLLSIPELCRRIQKSGFERGQRISAPEEAVSVLRPYYFGRKRELAYAVILDEMNRLKNVVFLSAGSANQVFIDPTSFLLTALNEDWTRVILSHSHPGGDPKPSKEDVEYTKSLFVTLRNYGICLVDHIIITPKSYCSFYTHYTRPPCCGYEPEALDGGGV